MYNIIVSKIEIYSSDYDDNQNVCNNGMNGKVFVTTDSNQYAYYNTAEALDNVDFESISEIVLYYQKNGVQYFKKLKS